MSETKLLEKIQCPNLTVTHKVIDGVVDKKTIYELLCEFNYNYSNLYNKIILGEKLDKYYKAEKRRKKTNFSSRPRF